MHFQSVKQPISNAFKYCKIFTLKMHFQSKTKPILNAFKKFL